MAQQICEAQAYVSMPSKDSHKPFMPWFYRYECFEISDLQKLPIDRLLSQNNEGLLCIWLTNSRKVHDSALRIIEEEWDLVPVAKWHWLKVVGLSGLVKFSSLNPLILDLPDERASVRVQSKSQGAFREPSVCLSGAIGAEIQVTNQGRALHHQCAKRLPISEASNQPNTTRDGCT